MGDPPAQRHPKGRARRPRAPLRKLEELLSSYGNQIQALALDNDRLTAENTRMLRQLDNPPTALRALHRGEALEKRKASR